MKTKIDKRIFGDTYIVFVSDLWKAFSTDGKEVYSTEKINTKVLIEDQVICVIAGDTIDEFYEQVKGLIEKYRI